MGSLENFYKSYAKSSVSQFDQGTIDCFDYGSRYYICKKSISNLPENYFSEQERVILELGCWNGKTLLYLAESYGFSKAIGVDIGISDPGVRGKSEFIDYDLNNTWPFQDGSVDVLVGMMVLEHLFNPWFCFSEIERVLRHDGRAFINLPLVSNLKNRFRLLFGKLPETSVPYGVWQKEGHWDGFHLHYFTIKSIRDLADAANMEIVGMEGVGKLKPLKDRFLSILAAEVSFELRKKKRPRNL
ncbi:class I SAM-dependent methyltransferase [Rhodospirillum sp. A1_3_36]|uniref:class I SAM-dependent methyltransferase n=1 Tax=Rhodospirillum sp. A1_3_36 TaxID=3391666 RepID=UPI0039A4E45D